MMNKTNKNTMAYCIYSIKLSPGQNAADWSKITYKYSPCLFKDNRKKTRYNLVIYTIQTFTI